MKPIIAMPTNVRCEVNSSMLRRVKKSTPSRNGADRDQQTLMRSDYCVAPAVVD